MNEKQAEKRIAEIEKETKKLNDEAKSLREVIERKSNVMLRVKTFADACIECGTTEEDFNKKYFSLDLDKDTIAYEKIKIIAKALNDVWVADLNNKEQRKYYPYFNASPFGFAATSYDFWVTAANAAGSRLCYKNSELAEYAGRQFESEYKEMIA